MGCASSARDQSSFEHVKIAPFLQAAAEAPGGKSLYLPIQSSLRAVHKEIYKKCCDTDHTEI